jgi:hypothetical protein
MEDIISFDVKYLFAEKKNKLLKKKKKFFFFVPCANELFALKQLKIF